MSRVHKHSQHAAGLSTLWLSVSNPGLNATPLVDFWLGGGEAFTDSVFVVLAPRGRLRCALRGSALMCGFALLPGCGDQHPGVGLCCVLRGTAPLVWSCAAPFGDQHPVRGFLCPFGDQYPSGLLCALLGSASRLGLLYTLRGSAPGGCSSPFGEPAPCVGSLYTLRESAPCVGLLTLRGSAPGVGWLYTLRGSAPCVG